MALSQSAVSELLEAFRAGEGLDLIRESVRIVLQELIEAEATEVIGAARYERTTTRTTERNGHRDRHLSTQAGDVALRIPKLRQGAFFPAILEPRRRSIKPCMRWSWRPTCTASPPARWTTWLPPLGVDAGISKSEVSRICAGLDKSVGAFRSRTPDTPASPTSTSMRPTCTCARPAAGRWCPRRSWWRPGSRPPVAGRSWAWPWATARRRRSGGRF